MLQAADEYTVDLFREILDEVHQVGGAQTLYSNIYDLNEGLIYLYFFHDFEHVVVLNVAEELAQGLHVYDLPSLFPRNNSYETWASDRIASFNEELAARIDDSGASQAVYESYSGRYTIPAEYGLPFSYVDISIMDGSLYFDIPEDARPPVELYPESQSDFFHTDYEHVLNFEATFLTDDQGVISGLVFEQDGVSVTFPREVGAE